MASERSWSAAPRPSMSSDRSAALCASLAVGWVVGLGTAGFATRMNPSLRDPGDATYVLLGLGVFYAVLFVPIGLLGLAFVRWMGRVRRADPQVREDAAAASSAETEEQPGGRWPFSTHTSVALSGFGAYVLAQLVAHALGAGEQELLPRLASLGALLGGLLGAAFVVTRQHAQAWIGLWRWLLPMSLTFLGGLFLLLGLGVSEVRLRKVNAEEDVLGGTGGKFVRVDEALARLPAPQQRRVIVIGLDGADWRRIQPLIDEGQLPSFQRLIERGVRSSLTSEAPAWPTIAWTTLATGVTPRRHGVRDMTEIEVPLLSRGVQRLYEKREFPALLPLGVGLRSLVDVVLDRNVLSERPLGSSQRRAKAVWNILSERGVSAAVVRWPASFPAESLEGWVIANDDPWTGDMIIQQDWDEGGPGEELAWPPDLRYELADLIERVRDGRELPRFGVPAPEGSASAEADSLPYFAGLSGADHVVLQADPRLAEEAGLVLAADHFSSGSALRLWRLKEPRILFVQLRCIDVLSHRCGELDSVIDGAYRFVDQALGSWLEAAGSETTIVLASAYGWEYAQGSSQRGHDHGPPGILVLGGSAVRAGVEFEDPPTIYDVAPTLLALYGLPPSREMPGRVLVEALRVGSRPATTEHPLSYGVYQFQRSLPGQAQEASGAAADASASDEASAAPALGDAQDSDLRGF